MFRLLGFLIGSIAALTIILVVLGVPQFHLSDPETDQARFDAAVKKLKQKQKEVVAQVANVDVTTPAAGSGQSADESAPEPDAILPVDDAPLAGESTAAHGTDEVPGDHQGDAERLPVADETLWYSFWNPFRSEIAARGFVGQLETVTGLDYRVVKVRTGVYEVAFAYGSDAERRAKLSQISAATGLDLPDS